MRRFVFASSCSMYGASGTDDAPGRGGSRSAHSPLRRVEGSGRGGPGSLADESFAPSRCGTRRSTASRRDFDSTSSSTTSRRGHTRPARSRLLSDGISVAAARPRPRRCRRGPRSCSKPRSDLVSGRGLQRRLGRAELPDRELADARLRRDRLQSRDRLRRAAGRALVPGRLSASSAGRCRASHSSGMPFPAFASSSTRIASSG